MYNKIPLYYQFQDFEPLLSSVNLEIHYDYLYDKYVVALNEIFIDNNLEFKPIEEVLSNLNMYDQSIRNDINRYGGGYYNHTLFFNSIIPPDYAQTLDYTMLDSMIDQQFGSKAKFELELRKKLSEVFGSGYTFLIVSEDNNLKIINTINQNNPLTIGLKPLLAFDIWEHSFYLDYPVEKSEYINILIDSINYKFGNYNLEKK